MDYEPVIGLEVHAQLLTRTKIFCGCRTRFGDPPNTNVCPVCLGAPGALPVLNRQVVEFAVRAALALECTVQPVSIFARKNYFYPDLPKGFQISQYEQPLATDGRLAFVHGGVERCIGIIRVHLEEDAGKSLHEGLADSSERTAIDYNRSGVPLIEIVTRPDLASASEAAEFFDRLRELLMAIEVNDGNMEEGSLRCDANVSVRQRGTTTLGTKTELKNLNSFRFLERALDFEIDRHIATLSRGDAVRQETRLWDASAGCTLTMRVKEEADDYRYFPEPDLPPLRIDRDWIDGIGRSVPELPEPKRQRLRRQYNLSVYDATQLTRTLQGGADYFERAVAAGAPAKSACNWVLGEIKRTLNERGTTAVAVVAETIPPERLARLLRLVDDGTISGSIAKTVFERMLESGREAADVVVADRLGRIADAAALLALVREVVSQHPGPVAQYRAGRSATFGFLVGQVMKASHGKADPKLVNDVLRRELDAGPPPQ